MKKSVDLECSQYLKSNKGSKRIMVGLKRKYESIGDIGGNYVLNQPTPEEKLFLRGLFKKDYSDQKSITIGVKKFEEAFNGSRFDGISLKEVLQYYFDGELETKKDKERRLQILRKGFFDKITIEYNDNDLKKWLESTLDSKKGGAYKWLISCYNNDREELKTTLGHLEDLVLLINENETGIVRPIAAAMITKDPHGLDDDTPLLKVLIYYLSYKYQREEPSTAEKRLALLEESNIITDSGNRTVLTYGLQGFDKKGGTLGWEAFYQRYEPIVLTLLNLKNASTIKNSSGNNHIVYCFENPSLFYTFIQRKKGKSCICVNGQINLAAYKLFELMEKSGMNILYHGDFDPEGLLIADRLCNRFDNISLFGYEKELYIKSMSNKKISTARLNQLKQLTNRKLVAIGELLEKHKKAGYEEYIIEALI